MPLLLDFDWRRGTQRGAGQQQRGAVWDKLLAAAMKVERRLLWGAQAREREFAKRDNPLVRRLARALLDASKMTLDEACKTDFERLAVEKELKMLERAVEIAKFKRR